MDHAAAISAITDWAARDENIRAVVVAGSVGRGPDEVDELSDLDVELYVADPAPLLGDDSWYAAFGEVLVTEALPNPGAHPTRLVHYVGGKIDFTIATCDSLRSATRDHPVRIVLDKDGVTGDMLPQLPPPLPPGADEVDECVNWFYAAALMEARLLARRELWLAKVREWDLMRQLLRMIEWDHKARYGWDVDTWYDGKRIDAWADPDVRSAAAACWAPYDATAMAASLARAVDLFTTLADRVAASLSLPTFDHSKVHHELRRLMTSAPQPPPPPDSPA